MNIILGILFIALMGLIVVSIVGDPFLIGKPRGTYTAGHYVVTVITGVLELIALAIACGVLFGGGA